MSDVVSRVEAFARSRRFHAGALDRWRGLAEGDAAALLEVAERLRLGENQWRDVFEWAEEIALRREESIASVLGSAPVRRCLEGAAGRNDALRALREALRRLRFPQLVAAEEALSRRVRALGLPRSVRVVLPEHLQGEEIEIRIRGAGVAAVRDAVRALAEAVERPELEEAFALLRGAP